MIKAALANIINCILITFYCKIRREGKGEGVGAGLDEDKMALD